MKRTARKRMGLKFEAGRRDEEGQQGRRMELRIEAGRRNEDDSKAWGWG